MGLFHNMQTVWWSVCFPLPLDRRVQSDWSRESRTSAGTATRCERGGRKPTKWTWFRSAVLPVALPGRPHDAPTTHFVQWEAHITQHSGCSTPRRKASYKAFNATFSSTPPPAALFLRPSVNKKLLSLTASQVCPLKAHTSLKLSAGPQRNALCTRKTHNSPPRETFKCAFFPPHRPQDGLLLRTCQDKEGKRHLKKFPWC